jgi:hypothetical protein
VTELYHSIILNDRLALDPSRRKMYFFAVEFAKKHGRIPMKREKILSNYFS